MSTDTLLDDSLPLDLEPEAMAMISGFSQMRFSDFQTPLSDEIFDMNIAKELQKKAFRKRIEALMNTTITFSRNGKDLSGRVWLVSMETQAVHAIDELDKDQASYVVYFPELRAKSYI